MFLIVISIAGLIILNLWRLSHVSFNYICSSLYQGIQGQEIINPQPLGSPLFLWAFSASS
jgi:hypothetical protein